MYRFLFPSLFLLSSCAGLDRIVGYDPETGIIMPDAPIGVIEEVGGAMGPYGQIVALAVGALAAGYIAFRKIQKKLGK